MGGGSLPVILRDLSEHGALVESTAKIPVDSEVLFCRNDLRVRGHVAWVRGPARGSASLSRSKPTCSCVPSIVPHGGLLMTVFIAGRA